VTSDLKIILREEEFLDFVSEQLFAMLEEQINHLPKEASKVRLGTRITK
jgi:hypothetical protein